mmetsp:Transcript_70328/g.228596  ORF Transcript_70328/g.228596 Transcript_70328/m.228596 type:complete len:246 (-) Transcript_70328:218-955(-)
MVPSECKPSEAGRAKRSETPPPTNRGAKGAAGENAGADAVRQRRPDVGAPIAAKEGEDATVASGKAAVGVGKAAADGGATALWAAYLAALASQPVRTKALTSAVISSFGNLFCQIVVESRGTVDAGRLLRFALLNAFYVAPVLHVWFGFLNRQIPRPGLAGAALRMLPDQLLVSPIFNFGFLFLLFSSSGTLVVPSATDLWECIVSSWKLWPVANLLIFWLVPPDLQLLAGSLVNLLWSVYLSTL